ncbi:MAG TPA: MAPEG family protein [Azospirillaceae bacterium]|nr:MAPEG family protein [Azospirillaceae bacterium]
MAGYPWTALATVAALSIYIWTIMRVGRARGQFGVPAPAMDGPPDFLRAIRVQANTVEQLVAFLPLLWLFAVAWGDRAAAAVGAVWCVGRILYAVGYYRAAERRSLGFSVSALAAVVLLLGVFGGAVMALG